jgi:hypothetical protein
LAGVGKVNSILLQEMEWECYLVSGCIREFRTITKDWSSTTKEAEDEAPKIFYNRRALVHEAA